MQISLKLKILFICLYSVYINKNFLLFQAVIEKISKNDTLMKALKISSPFIIIDCSRIKHQAYK